MTDTTTIMVYEPRDGDKRVKTRAYTGPAAGYGALVSVFNEAWRHTGFLRAVRVLASLNQVGGIDCSSCAWPDPAEKHRTAFEFCENGAKAVLWENTRARFSPDFFQTHTVNTLRTWSDHELEKQGRLTEPLAYQPATDTYEPVSWRTAFQEIGAHLRALDDPNDAIFYTSGRTSNEAAFLYQLFARQLGTNNLPDCSNMCHESSGAGLGETIGIGKGTVSLEDFEHADMIFVIGQNPGTNHPRMLTTLEQAAKRGASIIAINPLMERGLERFAHPQNPLALLGQSQRIATHYLQVRINGDVACLQGIAKACFELDSASACLDHGFIAEHTSGFQAYRQHIENTDWKDIEDGCGLSQDALTEIASLYVRARSTIMCWAMGLTQHENGVANVTEVVNLLLLKGNLGRRGAGACPVRGHSNVQGDRTMGIHEKPKPQLLDQLAKRYRFSPPQAHGYDTVGAIDAMKNGSIEFFMSMGGNFVAATPDTAVVARGMQKTKMTVHVCTRLNRTHLYPGQQGFILPCLVRSEIDRQDGIEQFVSCENSMSVVSTSRGKIEPASPHLRSEVSIICGIAEAALPEKPQLKWTLWQKDYDTVRNEIEAVIDGFADYNKRVRQKGGFVLPNSAAQRQWRTQSGCAEFRNNEMPRWSLKSDQLLLGTLRSHDQFNTTIYGHDDRYRGIFGGRRILMIDGTDLERLGFADGDFVDITSHFNNETRSVSDFKLVKTDLPRGCVMAYFPETNPLIPLDSYARKSRTPTSKSVVISLRATVRSS